MKSKIFNSFFILGVFLWGPYLSQAQTQKVPNPEKRIQALPKEEKRHLKRNLQQWKQLTPEQKEDLKKKAKLLQQLTPEQKKKVKERIEKWRKLPPEQRQLLRERLIEQKEETSD